MLLGPRGALVLLGGVRGGWRLPIQETSTKAPKPPRTGPLLPPCCPAAYSLSLRLMPARFGGSTQPPPTPSPSPPQPCRLCICAALHVGAVRGQCHGSDGRHRHGAADPLGCLPGRRQLLRACCRGCARMGGGGKGWSRALGCCPAWLLSPQGGVGYAGPVAEGEGGWGWGTGCFPCLTAFPQGIGCVGPVTGHAALSVATPLWAREPS